MKVAILASVVAAVNANYYGQANDGFQPNPCLINPYAPGCGNVRPQPPCTGYGCYKPQPPKPVYPVYPVKPIQPIQPVYPQPIVHPVQPIAPVVTVTVTEAIPPAITQIINKLPTTISCRRWNKRVNDGKCEAVNAVKCSLRGSKKSKFGPCNEATCCTGVETVTVTVAPAPTQAPATATVISCAQYAGQNSLQCQVTVEGACAVEGPFGQYNQCSKDLCCRAAAPVVPSPEVVSCKQVVAGNGWGCGYVPDFGCSVGVASGKYPACSYQLCCLAPIPPKPVNPCANCSKYWCPPSCDDYKPVDPCEVCGTTYYPCPSQCGGSANSGYQRYY